VVGWNATFAAVVEAKEKPSRRSDCKGLWRETALLRRTTKKIGDQCAGQGRKRGPIRQDLDLASGTAGATRRKICRAQARPSWVSENGVGEKELKADRRWWQLEDLKKMVCAERRESERAQRENPSPGPQYKTRATNSAFCAPDEKKKEDIGGVGRLAVRARCVEPRSPRARGIAAVRSQACIL